MTDSKITKDVRDPFNPHLRQVTAEEKAVDKARKEREFSCALIEVAGTKSGKIVLARIFEDAAFFSSSFDTNALAFARKEGRKEFAQTVFNNLMKYAPGVIMELRNENE